MSHSLLIDPDESCLWFGCSTARKPLPLHVSRWDRRPLPASLFPLSSAPRPTCSLLFSTFPVNRRQSVRSENMNTNHFMTEHDYQSGLQTWRSVDPVFNGGRAQTGEMNNQAGSVVISSHFLSALIINHKQAPRTAPAADSCSIRTPESAALCTASWE